MPRHGMVINIYPDGRVADHFDEFQETIATAVLVPPHGRLGDLNILAQQIEHERFHHMHTDSLAAQHHIAEYGHFLKAIFDAPTIIPASEEDRECEYVAPPQTRGDSIRTKSDEKLANFLVECCGCPPDLVDREYCGTVGCSNCWLNWLKKEKINDG